MSKDIAVIQKTLSNIVNNPTVEKYRSINIAKLEKYVDNIFWVAQFLKKLGFEEVQKGSKTRLELTETAGVISEAIPKLQYIVESIKSDVKIAFGDDMTDIKRQCKNKTSKTINTQETLRKESIIPKIGVVGEMNVDELLALVPESEEEKLAPIIEECALEENWDKLKHVVLKNYVLEKPAEAQVQQNMTAQEAQSHYRWDDDMYKQVSYSFRKWSIITALVLPKGKYYFRAATIFADKSKTDEEIKDSLRILKSEIVKYYASQFKRSKHIYNVVKEEPIWLCFACGNDQNRKTDDICFKCFQSFNPLHFARINKSESFGVSKKFGLCKVNQNVGFAPFIKCPLRFIMIFDADDGLTKNEYRIIEIRSCMEMENGRLTIGDLKLIIKELFFGWYNKSFYPDNPQPLTGNLWFSLQHFFHKLEDSCVIKLNPQNFREPYILQYRRHFNIDDLKIQPRFQIQYGNSKRCKYLDLSFAACEKFKYSDEITVHRCPYVSQYLSLFGSQDVEQSAESDKVKAISSHLGRYDHFESFGFEEETCPHGKNCSSLEKLYGGKLSSLEQAHHSFFKHDCRDEKVTESAGSERNIDNSDLLKPFEYNDHWTQLAHSSQFSRPHDQRLDSYAYMILLMLEAVNNGFESDLMPFIDSESKKFDFDLKRFCKQWKIDAKSRIYHKDRVKELEQYYGILSLVAEKMEHPKHKQMGSILRPHEMLAMLLYCNGDCNYDMSLSLRTRSGKEDKQKWPLFDECMWTAIEKLSTWESQDLFIYTGLCGIDMPIGSRTETKDDGFISSRTYHSFSTSMTVAKEFAGSEGLIIAIKLRPDRMRNQLFSCCSMSWISKYKDENEILVRKGSTVFLLNTVNVGNHQIALCSIDPLEDDTMIPEKLLLDVARQ